MRPLVILQETIYGTFSNQSAGPLCLVTEADRGPSADPMPVHQLGGAAADREASPAAGLSVGHNL